MEKRVKGKCTVRWAGAMQGQSCVNTSYAKSFCAIVIAASVIPSCGERQYIRGPRAGIKFWLAGQ